MEHWRKERRGGTMNGIRLRVNYLDSSIEEKGRGLATARASFRRSILHHPMYQVMRQRRPTPAQSRPFPGHRAAICLLAWPTYGVVVLVRRQARRIGPTISLQDNS